MPRAIPTLRELCARLLSPTGTLFDLLPRDIMMNRIPLYLPHAREIYALVLMKDTIQRRYGIICNFEHVVLYNQ